jgi:hypothetical protein
MHGDADEVIFRTGVMMRTVMMMMMRTVMMMIRTARILGMPVLSAVLPILGLTGLT